MSISIRLSGITSCRSLLPFAFAALAGLCSSAIAQTAPQLLPYTAKLIAGGGTLAIAKGATCPVSGFTSTDAYGDGCLATEIKLGTASAGSGPRYAVADSTGAIFFSDYGNALIRRVDPITGIVTAVAGGVSTSPTAGTACGSYASTDAKGDGCLATAVNLYRPTGLVFSKAGDLYFAEYGNSDVRKIAATNGLITTSGVISLVAGSSGSAYGYASNNATTTINAATQSYLDAPFGLAFDKTNGNLYIADEAKNAVLVVNTNTTGSNTVTGVTIPAGTIAKIIGSPTAGGSVCPNSPATTNGCNYGNYTSGALANSSQTDSPYGVSFDAAGNVYFADEFDANVGLVNTTTGILTSYAGSYPLTGTGAKKLQRAPAGTFAIGSNFGIAVDTYANAYITDALNGVVWRVDGAGQSMYVVAGGATSVCSSATDTKGDGCPATQATFGSSVYASGDLYSATGTTGNAGIFGVSVDTNSNLYVGDTVTNEIREIASGTQFGVIGANQPVQTVDIHFAAGDSPAAAGAYALTMGGTNFSLGTATCTTNSDTTQDCLLPITATPSALGPFTGTLQVTSTLGGISSFSLSGTYAESPNTRTVLTYATPSVNCTGTSTYSNGTPVVLTSTLVANGPNPPSGTITFYANGAQIGTQSVTNLGTASVPVYGATLTYTFSTVGTYSITATYGGNSYFQSSTSAPASISSSTPTFSSSTISYQQNTVVAGQTGLYSFNLIQNVYTGTITMSCSGLPANSSCSFSPQTITSTGCSTTSTVAMNINTQQGSSAASTSSLGGPGRGPWAALGVIPGLLLALMIGLRRRRVPMRYGQLWMALALLLATSGTIACSNVQNVPATPSGSYNITVTATGSTGTVSSFVVPFTVQ